METPNLSYIIQLADGSEEFIKELVIILKKELPQEIENYDNFIGNNDFLGTFEIVHKIKHKISLLGLEKSYYLAQEFEKNLKNNSTSLHKEFESILTIMNEFVKAL
jgi:HPt (histidine-containing phosphotransfer) domain-containing protein